MTNLLGHSLGRCQLLERLGQGGMATVYKAYDTRLERAVAVKVKALWRGIEIPASAYGSRLKPTRLASPNGLPRTEQAASATLN